MNQHGSEGSSGRVPVGRGQGNCVKHMSTSRAGTADSICRAVGAEEPGRSWNCGEQLSYSAKMFLRHHPCTGTAESSFRTAGRRLAAHAGDRRCRPVRRGLGPGSLSSRRPLPASPWRRREGWVTAGMEPEDPYVGLQMERLRRRRRRRPGVVVKPYWWCTYTVSTRSAH